MEGKGRPKGRKRMRKMKSYKRKKTIGGNRRDT